MPREFEIREEIALDATPEQVWDAIATGPGVDSWFMGRNEIEPREGGTARMTLLGDTQESTVTAWKPPSRLAVRSDVNPDGTFMAFEYLIEAREGGSTVLRYVHSGVLGDDWEAEYDALRKGDRMYLENLARYLKHFPGRTSTFDMFLPGPQVADAERVWAAVKGAFGLTGTVAEGDTTRLAVDGLPPEEGVMEFVREPSFLGVRTSDGLYLLVYGYQDTLVVQLHSFAAEVDPERTGRAWQSWLDRSFA